MTARTHDLGAFTILILAVLFFPVPHLTVATASAAVFTNMLGGLFPDIDESTGRVWHSVRGGSFLGKLIAPLLGGHRLITHSLLGLWLANLLTLKLFAWLGTVILVDMTLVQTAFMLGMISHLILDLITKEGIPLFFPLPWSIGLPPLKILRLKTGGLIEKSLVFPGLLVLNGYLIYHFYARFAAFITGLFT